MVPGTRPTPGCPVECTFRLKLVAVANPEVKSPKGAFDWSKLPLVLPPWGAVLREMVDTYFASLGTQPRVVAEASHPAAARKAVRSRTVATIVHKMVVEEDLAAGTLVELRPPSPLPLQEYKVVRPCDRVREAAQKFCRFIQERLDESTWSPSQSAREACSTV